MIFRPRLMGERNQPLAIRFGYYFVETRNRPFQKSRARLLSWEEKTVVGIPFIVETEMIETE
ncbi:MAG: hypothetical protein K0Q50_2044 [Vampirovibrio sp.]|jgi:hypothetical protein|nr:hypothetical protein [Vampirovibrio sp.]